MGNRLILLPCPLEHRSLTKQKTPEVLRNELSDGFNLVSQVPIKPGLKLQTLGRGGLAPTDWALTREDKFQGLFEPQFFAAFTPARPDSARARMCGDAPKRLGDDKDQRSTAMACVVSHLAPIISIQLLLLAGRVPGQVRVEN